jgi:sterol desaturase/sphingolipid hydroxylase (fatty acid hydroxylase superfamily)
MANQSFIYLCIVVVIALLELSTQRFRIIGISARDGWLDLLFFLQSMIVVGPIMAYGLAAVQTHLLPGYVGHFANLAVGWQFLAFIIFDDLVQYWFHRAVHKYRVLWPLHSPHHSAPYMGIRMVFRNGFFYNLIFPNVWLSGLLVYLGFGQVFLIYSLLKAVVTLLAHSELRWDEPLYRHAALRPLAWLLEHTISTPATHFAHHAANENDGIGKPNGNYGNLLFFWDVLFGTALITRYYPAQFGLPDAEAQSAWYVMLFYPLFRARSNSETKQKARS